MAEKSVNFEAGELVDIDGDGNAQEILADCQPTVGYESGPLPGGKRGLVKHVISAKRMNYGGGVPVHADPIPVNILWISQNNGALTRRDCAQSSRAWLPP